MFVYEWTVFYSELVSMLVFGLFVIIFVARWVAHRATEASGCDEADRLGPVADRVPAGAQS